MNAIYPTQKILQPPHPESEVAVPPAVQGVLLNQQED